MDNYLKLRICTCTAKHLIVSNSIVSTHFGVNSSHSDSLTHSTEWQVQVFKNQAGHNALLAITQLSIPSHQSCQYHLPPLTDAMTICIGDHQHLCIKPCFGLICSVCFYINLKGLFIRCRCQCHLLQCCLCCLVHILATRQNMCSCGVFSYQNPHVYQNNQKCF